MSMTVTQTKRLELIPVEQMHLSIDGGVLDAVIEIGQQREKILVAMREALVRGDDDEALERARELTGLPSKRPSNSRS
jgi:hypothetical protein